MKTRLLNIPMLLALSGTCLGEGNAEFERGMREANEGYTHVQAEKAQAQMKQYQKDAGTFVPGLTDKQVGPNTYVSPTYSNGSVGGTVTKTFP